MNYSYTKSLIDNIERTYTYAYAKNVGGYKGNVNEFDSIEYFNDLLFSTNPFKVFMELDHYAFQKAKNDIIRYNIPFTEQQERQARIFKEVTDQMMGQRSDSIAMYVDLNDLKDTGIILYKEPYLLTTEQTIYVKRAIQNLPKSQTTSNTVFNATDIELPEQERALDICLTNHISCLIGGAGTGKSFITAEIIDQLQRNNKKTVVLAPTHKAKEALQEKLNNKKINANARTIHSFVHNPSECDAIVIDESGMLSTPLFYKLMRVYKDQQLIFVGDKNQIPPVEYGRPFEKIQELFPVAELKVNHRSDAADIIALGNEILGIPQNANMPIENIELVRTTEEAFRMGAEVALTFTNANVHSINEEQKVKGGIPAICPKFSIGDKIIAKTNTDKFYNGQLFTITGFDEARAQNAKKDIRFYSSKNLEANFELAYGLTIHKSQGSEWNTVAYQPTEIDTQNLAYVAVTRARRKLIIISDTIRTEYKPDRKWRHL